MARRGRTALVYPNGAAAVPRRAVGACRDQAAISSNSRWIATLRGERLGFARGVGVPMAQEHGLGICRAAEQSPE